MAKVVFKDKKSLRETKRKARGIVSYRQMKDGRVIAAKWPKREKNQNAKVKITIRNRKKY